MIYLFIHQNFPAQYLHLVSHLAAVPENKVLFITQMDQHEIARVEKLVYRPELPPGFNCHPYVAPYDAAVRTAAAVMEVCRGLRGRNTVPDMVIGHSGWGETLFVKDVFPETPLLAYFEYYYRPEGADVGFDPEFVRSNENDSPRLRVRNTINRMSFEACDWGHTATSWQRSLFPDDMQARITTLHEGIDTERIRPGRDAWLRLGRGQLVLTRADEVITYVARNLEAYRGFHCLMRAVPAILQRRPRAHVVIVGGDDVSYGDPPPYGGSYREMMLAELGGRLDLERVHFLGQVPREVYLNVLQVSSVHVHFSYPFVLSWSLLEAMAAGCLVLGSANLPVLEVLTDGETGLAVDMFSPQDICDRIDQVFEHPDRMQGIRDAARDAVVQEYDLQRRMLPRWLRLLDSLSGSAASLRLASSA